MNLLYYIKARHTQDKGTQIRQGGLAGFIGRFFYKKEEMALLENVAREIAQAHPFYSISLVPQREDGLSAQVYFRMLDGRQILNERCSSREFWEERRTR